MTTEAPTIGKETVWFAPKTTPSRPVKTMMPVQNLIPTITAFDVQDDEDIFIVTGNDEIAWREDEIGNLLQYTSSED